MINSNLANDADFPLLPQCTVCKHALPGHVPTCKAFPSGIPQVMLANKFDHRQPYPGDNGITFEASPGYKHPEDARKDL